MGMNEEERSRPLVGLLVSHLEDDFDEAVCEGAMIAAEEADADLVVFPGRYIDGVYADKLRTEYEYQYNTLFDLPVINHFDVLIVLIGTLGSHLDRERKKQFLSRFGDTPVITVTAQIDDYPSITVDNRTGLAEVVRHLIKVHGCRNIGFMSGPKTSDDANERLAVYKEVIEANGIAYDENKVVYGNFSKYAVKEAGDLIDRNPGLEAIVFANDQMAAAGYKAMEERGLIPGRDILVTGFDNDPIAEELIPQLTTVKSDASELGFSAFNEALNLISRGHTANDTVASSMVCRNSCGCTGNSRLKTVTFRGGITDNRRMFAEQLCNFLFSKFRAGEVTLRLRHEFTELLFMIDNYLRMDNLHDRVPRDRIAAKLDAMLTDDFFKYITLDNLYTVMAHIHAEYTALESDPDDHLMINRLFIRIYQITAERNAAYCKALLDDNYFMTWQTNSITRDMLVFEAYDDRSYQSVVDKLTRLHMKSSYLFAYEPAITHLKTDTWKMPEYILLKSYHNCGEAIIPEKEEQPVRSDEIFSNKFLPQNRRFSIVLSPLFSNENHYGLLMCETEPEYFHYIQSVTGQLCAALKIISLMKSEAKAQKLLRQSLAEIKENNRLLSEISKQDELTGCFNRRGFFEEARLLLNEDHEDSNAFMIFADLDCLKSINDLFGHEEGDFALRSAAEILRRSFVGRGNIIGRIGGDEFVVCTFFDSSVSDSEIRAQIEKVSIDYNECYCKNKPYVVHTSVGVYQFENGDDIEIGELLSHADSLLYEQKKKKKNIIKDNVS